MQMLTETSLQTLDARRGLRKICFHFARSVPVSLYGLQSRIELPSGPCLIKATDKYLNIRIRVDSGESIDGIEQEMSEMLKRLVKPQTCNINWVRKLPVRLEEIEK